MITYGAEHELRATLCDVPAANPAVRAILLHNLAATLSVMGGRPREALTYIDRAQRLDRHMGMNIRLNSALIQVEVLHDLGAMDRGLDVALAASDIARTSGAWWAEASLMLEIAVCRRDLGDVDVQHHHAVAALAIAEERGFEAIARRARGLVRPCARRRGPPGHVEGAAKT